MERPTQYGKDTQRLEVDRKVLTSETVMKNKELRQLLQTLGVISGMPRKDTNLKRKFKR